MQKRPDLLADMICVPLRADLTVRIYGIPHDLTEKESAKIIAVLTALIVVPE